MEIVDQVLESKKISIDYETSGDTSFDAVTPFIAKKDGVAISWQNNDGTDGVEYWSFTEGVDRGYNLVSWQWFSNTLLKPIWNDESKTIVMHNAKFDLQVSIAGLFGRNLKASDIPSTLPKGKVEDTMLMSWMLNENLRVSLKELSKIKLDKPRKTFKQTENHIKDIRKMGVKEVKRLVENGWKIYKNFRQKSDRIEEPVPTNANALYREAVSMIPKLKKAEFVGLFTKKISKKVLDYYHNNADNVFANYAKEDATDTIQIYDILLKEFEGQEYLYDWYRRVEYPFMLTMLVSEIMGVEVDVPLLMTMEKQIEKIQQIRQEKVIAKAKNYGFDDKFNVRSHDQVKDLIWNRMKLEPPVWAKPTKKGTYPTNSAVMTELAEQGHEVCKFLTAISTTNQLQSTFVKPLIERGSQNIHGRVRTNYKTVHAVTGRVSSSPNFQNLTNEEKMPRVSKSILKDWFTQNVDILFPKKFVAKYGAILRSGAFLDNPVKIWDSSDEEPIGFLVKYVKLIGWLPIPKNDDELRLVPLRRVFRAPKGRKYIVADFSQIELRYLAHITQDPFLLEAYCRYDCFVCGTTGLSQKPLHKCPCCGAAEGERDTSVSHQPVINGFVHGLDIHCKTAEICNLYQKYDDPKFARKKAKPINFGLAYMMAYKTLATQLDVTDAEARKIQIDYFKGYKQIKQFHLWVAKQIRNVGSFNMVLGGRKRRFDVQKKQIARGLMKGWQIDTVIREAVNNVVQGSAADNMKVAAINYTREKMNHPNLKDSYVALNVHDELVIDVAEEHAEECLEVLRDVMENCVQLTVPILTSGEIVDTWDEAK